MAPDAIKENAREKMFDPAFQKSFTEAIHKENKIRVKWNLEHGSRFQPGVASCSWDDEPDDDDDDFIEEEEIGVQGVLLEKSEDKERVPSIFEMQMRELDPEKVKSPEVMKPVPINTKKLLYKGLSHHGEGKYSYLRARYKDDPENKFFFPICSSWEYGWTYGQHHDLKCSDHGRRQIMKTSFFRPNDPQLKPRD